MNLLPEIKTESEIIPDKPGKRPDQIFEMVVLEVSKVEKVLYVVLSRWEELGRY